MQCGLVDDGPADDGCAVDVGGEGQAVEPNRPSRSEMLSDTDRVPLGGRDTVRTICDRLQPAAAKAAGIEVLILDFDPLAANPLHVRALEIADDVVIVLVILGDPDRGCQNPSWAARVTASRRLVAPSLV